MPSGITVGCGLGVVFQQPARASRGAVSWASAASAPRLERAVRAFRVVGRDSPIKPFCLNSRHSQASSFPCFVRLPIAPTFSLDFSPELDHDSWQFAGCLSLFPLRQARYAAPNVSTAVFGSSL